MANEEKKKETEAAEAPQAEATEETKTEAAAPEVNEAKEAETKAEAKEAKEPKAEAGETKAEAPEAAEAKETEAKADAPKPAPPAKVEAAEPKPEAEAAAPAAAEKPAAEEEKEVAPTPVAKKRAKSTAGSDRIHGLGRRKRAVARVSLRTGEGSWKVNGRTLEDYFPRSTLQQSILRPLVLTETDGQYDVHVRVAGGGMHGQADAVRLGLSRALVKIDEDHRRLLRSEDLLTRDARAVERKKPGRPKARKRFQFSKR